MSEQPLCTLKIWLIYIEAAGSSVYFAADQKAEPLAVEKKKKIEKLDLIDLLSQNLSFFKPKVLAVSMF